MALQDDVRNLTSLAPFRDLDPEAVRLIAFSAETRILRAGDVLFRRGEVSDGGFVVLSGMIGVATARGGETLVRPPALFGEMALITETLRPATVVAREPTSVLKVPRTLYRRILAEYPSSAARVRAGSAARLFAIRGELEGLRRTMMAAG